MKIYIDGHSFRYEVESLTRMFLHGLPISVQEGKPQPGEDCVYTGFYECGKAALLRAYVQINGRRLGCSECQELGAPGFEAECERLLAVMLYRMLTELTGVQLRWGVLTGIRPVKLAHRYHAEGLPDEAIRRLLREKYLVSDPKIDLLLDTARQEAPVLALSQRGSYSLYLSIPFCPSRCRYCSFVSHSIEKTRKLMPEYVKQLVQEIEYTAGILDRIPGLKLETIYFGGGTPTALEPEQLGEVMQAVDRCFDCRSAREYTVEAGRPDTITPQKLEIIKQLGATRISINPQTMNDDVLREIGRRHTAQQTLDAFAMARQAGHQNINMDLIAGLPADTHESFCGTVDQVIALEPENITLHTLSVKRAATLAGDAQQVYQKQSALVNKMLDYARARLCKSGYLPYYLYRQKNTVGNLENVGYAKPGYAGLYNVYIMDETHSILALGAGGVSKLRQPGGELISRVFNYKYPYEYLRDFEEILRRKDKIAQFYEEYPAGL